MSPIWKKPIHAKLPHITVSVATFILTLISSAVIAYINSANAAACSPSTSTSGNATIVSFTTTGTCEWSVPAGVSNVDVLVVGGGGGGASNVGGGGAGGGVTTNLNFSVTPSSSISITVGAGGAGGTSNGNGTVGGSSSFSTVTAVGGDYGRTYSGSANGGTGSGGGGSGGRGSLVNTGATENGYAGTYSAVTGLIYGGGGGGGAYRDNSTGTTSGGLGVNGGANGGTREAVYIFSWIHSNTHPVAATANTGGGGGGGVSGGGQPGSAGGSGIVVIKYISQCGVSTTSGNYTIVSFTTTGTCNWSVPNYVNKVDVLVIGGGGAGGSSYDGVGAGGGGAGGFREISNLTLSQNSYSISVGYGGFASTTNGNITGGDGTSSTFGSYSVNGGGGGSAGRGLPNSGASGGGAGGRWGYNSGLGASATSVSPTLGNSGGNTGSSSGNQFNTGGGGGGSSSVGGNGATSGGTGGSGGLGTSNSISGSSITYAAGGAGGSVNATSNGVAGTANTGNGGGGASILGNTTAYGGSGGSGIVIIKFISECNPTVYTNSSFTYTYRYSFAYTGFCNWVSPSDVTNFKYLIVGGGGGGGRDGAGGGGGGQVDSSTIVLTPSTIYTITVGSGGSNSTVIGGVAGNGGVSKFENGATSLLLARGGGGGGSKTSNGVNAAGSSTISSGGGAGHGGSYTGGSGNSTFGFAGGNGVSNAGGGGGGASSAGTNATSGQGGLGGNGISSYLSGQFINYGSGGGGGSYNGIGGAGGTNAGTGGGASVPATTPTDNSGGGGGAAGVDSSSATSGAAGIFLLVNDFDSPTISWTTPSSSGYINSANYSPDWSLSDSSSGISSSSGTAKRQYTTLTNGVCGTSWTTEATQSKATSTTLTAERCYRWTFDSTVATGAVAPVDNIGTAVTTNLTSSTIIYDPIPTVSSVTSSNTDGVYTYGETLSFTITFSESVTVTGNPQLTLETGTTDQTATCSQSTTPSTTLTCSLTIARESFTSDLDYASTSALSLNGGSIADYSNNAILTLPTLGSANSIAGSKALVISGSSQVSASGGTVTTSGNYIVHTFNSNGTFTLNTGARSIDVLVVGGGGGGGYDAGGGGGGGGIAYKTGLSVSNGDIFSIYIGNGGRGGTSALLAQYGGSSSIVRSGLTLATAIGGSNGGRCNYGQIITGGPYFCRSGNWEGTGGSATASGWTTTSGSNGGRGFLYSPGSAAENGVDGTSVFGNYYSGGGGGGYNASGGNGGGGNGSNSGTENTGGGGGGGGANSNGGAGGKGVVVIRYLIDTYVDVPIITSSQNGTTTSANTNITFTGETGATFECKLNSGSYSSCTSPYSATGLSNGTNTFYVRQTDSYTNLSEASSITWTVDATSPTISSFAATTNSPTSDSTIVYSLLFSEDVTGLTSSDFTATGWNVAVTSGSGAGPYEITLTKTTATDGNISLVLSDASVIDSVSNSLSSSSSSRTAGVVTYDATNPTDPTISINSSTCGVVRNTPATLTFSATDLTSGLLGYRYTTDGTTPTSLSTSASSLTVSSEGSTEVKVRSIDNAGNLSSTASCTIDIDSIVPLGNWYVQPNSPTSLSTLNYTLIFDEAVTGLTTTDFTISGTATGCSVQIVENSSINYTVSLTSCSQGTIQLTLLANSVTDGGGNSGPAVNLSSLSVVRSVVSVSTISSSISANFDTSISSSPISASGGVSSLTYSISPSLPAGLIFNTSTGAISGTPSVTSSITTYTVSVTDGYVSDSSNFTLQVDTKNLVITADDLTFNYLQSIDYTISQTGLSASDEIGTVTFSYSGTDNSGDSYLSTSAPTNAGTYTVTPTSVTFNTGNANYYNISFVAGDLTINKISQSTLTLSAASTNVYYQETTSLSLAGGSGTGSETITVASGNPCSISSNTLTVTGVGTCTITATKASSANYNSATSTVTINALAFPVTITADDVSINTGATFTPSYTNTSLKNSDSLDVISFTYEGVNPTYYANSSTAPTSSGTYSIIPQVASLSTGDINNYSFIYVNGDLDIRDLINLTIDVDDISIEFGDSFTPTFTVSGLTGSDAIGNLTYSYIGVGYGPSSVKPTNAGNYTIRASSPVFTSGSSSNYNIVINDGNLTISTKSVTITAQDLNLIYGDSDSPEYINTSLAGVDTIDEVTYQFSGTNSTTQPTDVGSYTITPTAVQMGIGSTANYSFVYVGADLEISPKTLNLRASSPTIDYGDSYSPTLIDVNSSLVGSDAISSNTFTYSPTANPSDAGVYSITPSSAIFSSGSASNYSINYLTGTLTINKISQNNLLISVGSTVVQIGDTTSVTSSGGSGSGTVSYSVSGDCSLSGTTITTTRVGTCAIYATKAASTNYLSINSETLTITVNPVPRVDLTTSQAPYSNSDTLIYDVTFNLNTSGLTINDFTANGWTKTLTGSDKNYVLTLTSPDNTVTDGVVSVSISKFYFIATNTDLTRDTVAPTSVAQFQSTPDSLITTSNATFVFSGAAAGEIYQCKLDNGIYQTCNATHQVSNLTSGVHTMSLRIADLAGNYTSSQDFSWSVSIPQSSSASNQATSQSQNNVIQEVTKTKDKPEIQTNKARNPLTIIPDFLKPWLEKIPFLSPENQIPNILKPSEKLPEENSPGIYIDQNKLETKIEILDQNKQVFDPNASIDLDNYDLSPTIIEVSNPDGSFVRISSLEKNVTGVNIEEKNLIVPIGSKIFVESSGNLPKSQFTIWLRSEPIFLGQGYTSTTGQISESYSIPDSANIGIHRIEVKVLSLNKKVKSIYIPVEIKEKIKKQGMILVDENPVEKYLNQLTFIIMAIFVLFLIALWAVISLVRDSRKLKAQLRN